MIEENELERMIRLYAEEAEIDLIRFEVTVEDVKELMKRAARLSVENLISEVFEEDD